MAEVRECNGGELEKLEDNDPWAASSAKSASWDITGR